RPPQGVKASARAVSQIRSSTFGGMTSESTGTPLLSSDPDVPVRDRSMSRVLVVGWDGGSWTVANQLAAEGRLPVLASLRTTAAEGVIESVPNMNSAPAWSTIATGLNPGRHGIFYFDERVPGTYGRRL